MSIERRFDTSLIASLALKEKQIQQNYRPIIAVHKWFARRTGQFCLKVFSVSGAYFCSAAFHPGLVHFYRLGRLIIP